MAEISIRVSGRNVSLEVSEEEARKILDQLLFQPVFGKPVETIKEAESKKEISTQPEIDVSSSDFLPNPSKDEISAFIKSQPEYRHSVESIAEHFAHKKVSSADGRAAELWRNAIRGAGNRIRDEIEKEEGGEWKFERRARQKIFRFVKAEIETEDVKENLGKVNMWARNLEG